MIGHVAIREILESTDAAIVRSFLHVPIGKFTEININEDLDIVSPDESNRFWKRLKDFSFDLLQSQPLAVEDSNILRSISSLILLCCEKCQQKTLIMFETLEILAGVLLLYDPDGTWAVLKRQVSKACEYCWINSERGAGNLVPLLLPYLLTNALQHDARDVDVKRLYVMREAFLLLDIDNATCRPTRDLILRCFINPIFLKQSDGQKFLAFMATINDGALIEFIVKILKPQMASGSKPLAASYGEIFFRAWKLSVMAATGLSEAVAPAASTGLKASLTIEDALQLFVREAIHSANVKYAKNLRQVLSAFSSSRRSSEMDSMLLRVYGPIIWRSLRCANALVREQSALVFFDVFPLQETDASVEKCDSIVQKQFDLLFSLLKDEDHRVRTAATTGVCMILKDYWESLPVATTHEILRYLIETLGFDVSSSNVRLAVFNGLGVLFQQPLAHSLLAKLLPLLRNSIHDNCEKVRVAFIKVLTQMKGIRAMNFVEVVPVECLLGRMATDSQRTAVCSALSELLVDSFYPQALVNDAGVTISGGGTLSSEQVKRCVAFCHENIIAAEVFYRELHCHVSLGSVVKLASMLICLFDDASIQTGAVVHVGHHATKTKPVKRGRNASAPPSPPQALTLQSEPVSVRMSLVRVLNVLLSSVMDKLAPSSTTAVDLSLYASSRLMVLKYFTPFALNQLLDDATGAEAMKKSTEACLYFSLVLELSARINKVRATSEANSQTDFMNVTVLLELYATMWQQVAQENARDDEGSDAGARYLEEVQLNAAKATADVILSMNYGVQNLVEVLSDCFRSEADSITRQQKFPSQKAQKRRHEDMQTKRSIESDISAAGTIAPGPALDLVRVILSSDLGFISSELQAAFDTIFDSIQSMTLSVLKRAAQISSEEEEQSAQWTLHSQFIGRALYLWLSFCLQRDAASFEAIAMVSGQKGVVLGGDGGLLQPAFDWVKKHFLHEKPPLRLDILLDLMRSALLVASDGVLLLQSITHSEDSCDHFIYKFATSAYEVINGLVCSRMNSSQLQHCMDKLASPTIRMLGVIVQPNKPVAAGVVYRDDCLQMTAAQAAFSVIGNALVHYEKLTGKVIHEPASNHTGEHMFEASLKAMTRFAATTTTFKSKIILSWCLNLLISHSQLIAPGRPSPSAVLYSCMEIIESNKSCRQAALNILGGLMTEQLNTGIETSVQHLLEWIGGGELDISMTKSLNENVDETNQEFLKENGCDTYEQ